MNPVVEEALTNLIGRVDRLENSVKECIKLIARLSIPNSKGFMQPIRKGLITSGQSNYIKMLGGVPKQDMTKQEAGIEIDRLLKEKEMPERKMVAGAALMDPNIKDSNRVIEPPEVDTDNAGLDSEDLL